MGRAGRTGGFSFVGGTGNGSSSSSKSSKEYLGLGLYGLYSISTFGFWVLSPLGMGGGTAGRALLAADLVTFGAGPGAAAALEA